MTGSVMLAKPVQRCLILALMVILATSCAPARPHTPNNHALYTAAPANPISEPAAVATAAIAAEASPTVEEVRTKSETPNDEFNIVLGRPTDRSISVSLYSIVDRQATIEYGPAAGSETQTLTLALQANAPVTLELSDLAADTEYRYRVIADGLPDSEHRFHTQRPPGSSFTFTIDADPHNRDPRFNGELYTAALSNALADRPDFHINLGDTFMTEKLRPQTYEETKASFTDMRPFFGILAADAPLFLVNGNHEGELGWLHRGGTADLPAWSAQLRRLYYPGPIPGDFYSGGSVQGEDRAAPDTYYALTWGDALFVVLDPFSYTTNKPRPDDPEAGWNWTLGRQQYDWLKTTLASSPASYKFIFIHHLVGGSGKDARGGIEAAPYFEWGGNSADGSYAFDAYRPGWGKPIHQLLVDTHVTAVFHGHDHVFVKQVLDGIVYQELPQPSNAEYDKTSLAAEAGYTHGDVLGSAGTLRILVSPVEVTVEYVRAYLPGDEKPGQQNGQVSNQYNLMPSIQ